MKAGDILTETFRLNQSIPEPPQRKVYLHLGPSRVAGKIRVATWSHQARDWSLPHAEPESEFSPAPLGWPQTKAVKRWLAEQGKSTGVLMTQRGRNG